MEAKGTGRARHGSIRSPQPGGGVVFVQSQDHISIQYQKKLKACIKIGTFI